MKSRFEGESIFYGKKRRVVCFFIGLFIGFLLCAATWAVFDCIGKRTDSARMSEYADRSESAQELTSSAERGLDELAEQMQRAGDAVAECSTDVAELRIYSDRITEANKGIEGSASRIEESVYTIMRILEPG